MIKNYPGEQWKVLKFDFEFTNDCSIEVSNLGRIRTFNKISNGNIVKGSSINGYGIIRLKFYKPRDPKVQEKLDYLQRQVNKLAKKIRVLKDAGENKKIISESTLLLNTLKANLSKKFQADMKSRTINYHALIHRLVAQYFLKKPSAKQTIVAHLDFNKLNNKVDNLKWMTPDENYAHQKMSPNVIKEKKDRKLHRNENRASKLTVTKVMLLKKLFTEGKSVDQLAKQFKVTNTQVYRIKRGENWGDIPAEK